jgi:hypothetical protein
MFEADSECPGNFAKKISRFTSTTSPWMKLFPSLGTGSFNSDVDTNPTQTPSACSTLTIRSFEKGPGFT